MRARLTLLLALLLLPASLFAQFSRIKGKVVDAETGEALVGANVLVVGTSFGAATNINGEYTIPNLEAGTYEVKASYVGYQSKSVTDVRINTGLTTELNFELLGEGYEIDQVTVVAEKPLVNKSATNATRIATAEDIEALPVRGLNSIVALEPGVTAQDGQIYVRGGRRDEVGFYLEGTSITNPVYGGRAVSIPQDAIEEVQVQSGGYTAEYGGANAGIVITQLKSGGQDYSASVEYITDDFTFKGKDNLFDGEQRLGAYSYGHHNLIATFGGPVGMKNIRIFGALDYVYMQDADPQPWPGMDIGWVTDPTTGDSVNLTYPAGLLYNNWQESYNGSGTLTLDFNPIIARLHGTYATNDYKNPWTGRYGGNIANIMNQERVQEVTTTNMTVGGKFTYIVSSDMFFELSGGYMERAAEAQDPFLKDDWQLYGDSVANANVGFDVFRQRYLRPARLQLFTFTFHAPGDPLASYSKSNYQRINASLSGNYQWKEHTFKAGGELQMFTLRSWAIGSSEYVAQQMATLTTDAAKSDFLKEYGLANYGYDMLGEPLDGSDDLLGARQPMFIAGYVQDKIEWNDLIVNAGLRFDYYDIDNLRFVDPAKPQLAFPAGDPEIDVNGLEEVPVFMAVSPRLGFSFAVTDRTVFHAQYGQFVQQTRLRDVYQGWYYIRYALEGGFEITAPVGYDVRPTRTTQYEVGFTQQLGEFASFDITGFYKDVKDQTVFKQQDTDGEFASYNILTNGDFATTKGVEIAFNMRRVERVLVNANMSFQDAQGTGSYPNSNRGIVGAPLDGVTVFAPQYVAPLEFNQAFRGNLNIDYRFGRDDGPVPLHELGASLLLSFNSGHPFTLGQGGADLEGDARNRRPVEPLNNSTTPSQFRADLRVDKTFRIMDLVSLNIYVQVYNLFDNELIENVFLRTGTPKDDGYISDPELGGQLVETYGDIYAEVYRAINIDYYEQYQNATTGAAYQNTQLFYGTPRQIRVGVRVEY
ncbi:MAG: TonB-dependent receptor [Ignavibacteriales bacterium]|nr:TonB-dependent receptor [Ignavibacteriales bacterium]